jgi:hypothetical protein
MQISYYRRFWYYYRNCNVWFWNTYGTITKDLTIKKGTYYIDGLVRITDGVKLTIEPGATFYAKTLQPVV